MSVFKNIYSPPDAPGDQLSSSYSDDNPLRKGNENQYSNNDNVDRVEYVRPSKSFKEQEHRSYVFWALVIVLFALALFNLILTLTILGVLRLSEGMESLELASDNLVKFFGETDLDEIYKKDGLLESFNESPMEVLGDEGDVRFTIVETDREFSPNILIGPKMLIVNNVHGLELTDPATGKLLFSADDPNFGLPEGVNKLNVNQIYSRRITSAVDEGITITGDTYIKVKGSEGVHIDGKESIWSADQDILLQSLNRSIFLQGHNGVIIDKGKIPVTMGGREKKSRPQYKMCACMPGGRLFRTFVPSDLGYPGCLYADKYSACNY